MRLGERVRLEVGGRHQTMRFVGVVALPALGPLLSDRTGLGLGRVRHRARPLRSDTATFAGLHLREGADPAEVLAGMRPTLARWDTEGDLPLTYTAPIRPPEIVNVDAIRGSPLVLAGALGVALFTALALSIGASVAAVAHDHAIQRALGYTAGQVGQSRSAGRRSRPSPSGSCSGSPPGSWPGDGGGQRFADELGVAQPANVPAFAILVIVLVALVGALLVSVIPARRAGRQGPAAALGVA